MVAQLKVAGGGVSGGGALLTPCPSRLRQAWEEVEVAKKGDSKRIGGWEEGGGGQKRGSTTAMVMCTGCTQALKLALVEVYVFHGYLTHKNVKYIQKCYMFPFMYHSE